VPLTLHKVYCVESGIVSDLGCHGGVTKDSVPVLILHCGTGKIQYFLAHKMHSDFLIRNFRKRRK
jgi:hypothetical protein